MKESLNFSLVWEEFKNSFKDFYPYFLGFYIISVFVSLFFLSWKAFFYWPAFHAVAVVFTIFFVYLIIRKVKPRDRFYHKVNFNRKKILAGLTLIINFYWQKISALSRASLIKIFVIIVVLIFSLYQQIDVINFLILAFGLISILFTVDNRWSAGAALVFLASCPVLLIAKKDILAEKSAIYAYYLLVISVLTMIHEVIRDGSSKIKQ